MRANASERRPYSGKFTRRWIVVGSVVRIKGITFGRSRKIHLLLEVQAAHNLIQSSVIAQEGEWGFGSDKKRCIIAILLYPFLKFSELLIQQSGYPINLHSFRHSLQDWQAFTKALSEHAHHCESGRTVRR